MTRVRDVFEDGVRRVVAAPCVLAGVFVVTCVLALPLALTLRTSLQDHLGSSLEANAAADGVNYDWWQEFSNQAHGLSTTFSPSIIGFAAVLDNISGILDGQGKIVALAGVLATYLCVWTFLLGGIIDRYARQRPTRAHGFFAAGGVFFFRFLRLAIVAGLVYSFLYLHVHDWLFDHWFVSATRDLDSERAAFAWRVLMYVIFGALLLLVNVLMDYAKVRAVVEDRRSAIGALAAAVRFCWRHKVSVAVVYGLNVLLFLVVIAIWAVVAPGAGGAGASMWMRFAVAQIYLLARLFLKLQFVASQTSLFQASLAHARYSAAPAVVWPESPAAAEIP